MTANNPWHTLNPHTALDAVESVTEQSLTNLCLTRNSYINRVYEMETQDKERIIVKFYRPQRWTRDMIQEEHDFLHHCHEQELPVIPPLTFNQKTLFAFGDIPFTIFPKKGGRVIDELTQPLWEETGRLLGRLHTIGAKQNSSNRMLWSPETATQTHLETLLKHPACIPPDYEPILKQTITTFIKKETPYFQSLDTLLLHGDCHFGNIIYRPDESLYLVDFDDSARGPAVQDLWMLLPDETKNCQQEIGWFLSGYTLFRDFQKQELSLIPSLKCMRQIHFAAWCALQHQEPQFQHHFPDWGGVSYWNTLIKDLQLQLSQVED